MSPRKHALVLGGTGFIGSELVRQLLQKNYRVSVTVHERAPFRQFEDCNLIPSELSEFKLASLQHDAPDIAFHLARIPGKGKAGRLKSATSGAAHNDRLLSESKSQFPGLKWVYVSGSLMYGDHGDDWVDENFPMNPMAYAEEYAIAEEPFQKALTEGMAMMIHPPWILGNASWFKHFYLKVMQEEGFVPQYGSGQEWMNLIHLEDCAGRILHFSERGSFGQRYNLLGSAAVQSGEFLKVLSELSGLPVTAKRAEGDEAGRAALASSIRLTSLHSELHEGFQDQHPDLREMLRSLLPEGVKA